MRERKYKKPRSPKRVFVVICEGETEKVYVEVLKRFFRLPVAVKTKVSGNRITARLVNQYLKEFDLHDENEYRLFYIYDADVKEITEKLLNLKVQGTVILSNPCIELWFMLHCASCRRYQNSDTLCKALKESHPLWKSYVKGFLTDDQRKMLWNNRKDAILKAKELKWPENPSSNMHSFLEALEEAEAKGC